MMTNISMPNEMASNDTLSQDFVKQYVVNKKQHTGCVVFKQDFVKHEFVKPDFVKRSFAKHDFVERNSAQHALVKRNLQTSLFVTRLSAKRF